MDVDWAVQNKHLAIVKELLQLVYDLDVLAQNTFGRGCVTEAFQCEDAELCNASTVILHKVLWGSDQGR